MPAPRHVLGISAFYHDAAAALVWDGKIICAAQEERFTRKKNDPEFPAQAVQFCLRYANLTPAQLDAVVFYDKPVLKFTRLLETYLAVAPGGGRARTLWSSSVRATRRPAGIQPKIPVRWPGSSKTRGHGNAETLRREPGNQPARECLARVQG
jgi:predicted NodU family carbamoyl transferase